MNCDLATQPGRRWGLFAAVLAGSLLALAVALAIPPAPASAGTARGASPRISTSTYSYTVYIPVVQTSPPWATINSRQVSRDYYLTHYVSDTSSIAMNWTGSESTCTPGTTSPAFRDAVLRRINFFRAMAGVPANLILNDSYNALAQAAALLMSRNSDLNHYPPSSWSCYSSDASTGAGSSNLALGAAGTAAINLYMQDPGAYNAVAGHRRWILFPQTRETGTGDVPANSSYWAANALHSYDTHIWEQRPPTREAFVAWPPPGFVPYTIVYARWSFAYAGADFSSASVAMSQGSTNLTTTVAVPVNGYGENTLVWIPMGMNDFTYWPRPSSDMPYHVTVSNVLIGGQPRSFAYDVTVYDPAY